MASKTPKTLRLSDDIIRLIEEQPGKNFTEKFEWLVIKCIQELPEAQEQLRHVRDQIADERRRLSKATQQRQELERKTQYFNQLLGRTGAQIDQGLADLQRLLDKKT